MDRNILVMVSRSAREVAKEKSLSNKDFLINSRKKNILSLYLAWIAKIAVITENIIALAINHLREKSIGRLDGK